MLSSKSRLASRWGHGLTARVVRVQAVRATVLPGIDLPAIRAVSTLLACMRGSDSIWIRSGRCRSPA